MQRRTCLWGAPGSMIAVSLSLSSCTTTPAGSDTMGEQKDKRRTIDSGVDSTLSRRGGKSVGTTAPRVLRLVCKPARNRRRSSFCS
jgi:hypothetical protein